MSGSVTLSCSLSLITILVNWFQVIKDAGIETLVIMKIKMRLCGLKSGERK
jgi:hypothetical protein